MSFDPTKPLCFVIMPFGKKPDPKTGKEINFNDVYEKGIRPGIEAAGLQPIRADEEQTIGIIHKPMFERLILCDYAVADLTTANANVFYEIGVRHAVRPATTLTFFADQHFPPFDVNFLRCEAYTLGEGNSFGDAEGQALAGKLATRLKALKDLKAQDSATDSPIFQLLPDYPQPQVKHLKTDIFRDQVKYAETIKEALAKARSAQDKAALLEIETGLGATLSDIEVGVLIDLFLSYRAIKEYQAMVDLYARLPTALQRSVMMREQWGFALNRLERRDEARAVLEEVLKEQGDSSETCGLVGRVYKDQWSDAKASGAARQGAGFLTKAIEMYRKGFEADLRDYYPGVNAVTLLEIKGDPQSLAERDKLLPVVRFAVEQKRKSGKPDYWTFATELELAVLASDADAAMTSLDNALAAIREPWEPETTANNLGMIREARAARGLDVAVIDDAIKELTAAAAAKRPVA